MIECTVLGKSAHLTRRAGQARVTSLTRPALSGGPGTRPSRASLGHPDYETVLGADSGPYGHEESLVPAARAYEG